MSNQELSRYSGNLENSCLKKYLSDDSVLLILKISSTLQIKLMFFFPSRKMQQSWRAGLAWIVEILASVQADRYQIVIQTH